jgi:AcrR family transcriptional regulator
MSPDSRREQLLAHGVRLLSSRTLDELSIEILAEEAGISRGLLYHYFGNKQDFQRAVCRRAADDLIEVTAPVQEGTPLERLAKSLEAYVDYVAANYAGYLSLVRGAAGGSPYLQEIYEEARAALTDRIFDEVGRTDAEPQDGPAPDDRAGQSEAGLLAVLSLEDTPAVRLMVRGWSAMAEEVVLSWVRDPADVSRAELVTMLAAALPGMLSGTG